MQNEQQLWYAQHYEYRTLKIDQRMLSFGMHNNVFGLYKIVHSMNLVIDYIAGHEKKISVPFNSTGCETVM